MPQTERPMTLSARVRKLTQDDHTAAETSSFITELMSGNRSTRDYALLLSQYFFIYASLDAASEQLRSSTHLPGVAQLLDPKLDRREAIRTDLKNILPSVGLSNQPVQLEATAEYAARIREVAEDPARLSAHHYLRYLGDLSGGLAIARLVQRHYDIPDEQLNMYTFASIPKPKLYKDAYREQLNNLGLTSAQEDVFIREASRGFQYNKAIFEALGRYSAAQTPVGV